MTRKNSIQSAKKSVADYRHEAKRKNNPPAGIAAQGSLREVAKVRYSYNPHRPPVLRYDSKGLTDGLKDLLAEARTRRLTEEETRTLANGLQQYEPWLEWTGKRETSWFEVDPVALHIHERISTQAILRVMAREDVQRDLFADPEQSYAQAVQFYQHDVDWSNRMILGDSLQVMASLARREDLAGRVQMIYLDPPYGIKFASNFQPQIGQRDVKDREQDLTREPEMVRAYRDTWTLGIHSYLAYVRDRLSIARELLADTGSLFVQISDENLHRVRLLMDEVFRADNCVATIVFSKTSSATVNLLPNTCDYILWYAKDKSKAKYRALFYEKYAGKDGAEKYDQVIEGNGHRRPLRSEDLAQSGDKPTKVYRLDNITSQSVGREKGEGAACWFPVELNGREFRPSERTRWKTNEEGMERLLKTERVLVTGNSIAYVRYLEDFAAAPLTDVWSDIGGIQSRSDSKVYVVQTSVEAVKRCLLMTTDPGDLVLDPTCGSGTTAYVAEQWGRRWVTCDTSRVALALARQRLMTARFPFFELRALDAEDLRRNPQGTWLTDPTGNLSGKATLHCKTVPHITLKSIARNSSLDRIIAKYEPILSARLHVLNTSLKYVTSDLRQKLAGKLYEKEKKGGKKSITEADRRRWALPLAAWRDWEVPFDSDGDWPKPLVEALALYRAAWLEKINEVNACITAHADLEELVDSPRVQKGVVRVTGPFTMEAVMPAEESIDVESKMEDKPQELQTFESRQPLDQSVPQFEEPINAEAYLDKMIRLLKGDGVRFPNNRSMKFKRLESCGGVYIHADGEWEFEPSQMRTVAVSIGPQYGAVTGFQVETALPLAGRRGYDDLVFAGFSFDAAAQGIIQDDPHL
jgi:adenine-specific DNA-methyltransferase